MLLSSGGGAGGTALYTVRGVGSGSLDVDAWTQTSLYAEDRGLPSTDDPGVWQNKCFFRSYDLLDWSTLSLSGNKTHLPSVSDSGADTKTDVASKPQDLNPFILVNVITIHKETWEMVVENDCV